MLKDLFKVGFSFCFDASASLCEADVFFWAAFVWLGIIFNFRNDVLI